MKVKTFITILAIFVIHVANILCQDTNLAIVLPSQQGEKSEVISVTKEELNALEQNTRMLSKIMQKSQSCVSDTICPPYNYSVRFGASPGDTMAFCIDTGFPYLIKSIGIFFADADIGTECHSVNVNVVKSKYNYRSHPVDSVEAHGWLGEFTDDGWKHSSFGAYPIIWEDGHKPLLSDTTVNILENLNKLIFLELKDLGSELEVGFWDRLLVLMTPVGDPDGIIRWKAGEASGRPQLYGLKSYIKDGPSGKSGWHVRDYYWLICVVVENLGHFMPRINFIENYGSVLNTNPKKLKCEVLIPCNDSTKCEVKQVYLNYRINDSIRNRKEMDLISGTKNEGIWEVVLPAGYMEPGDEITFEFTTLIQESYLIRSEERKFKYFMKKNPFLVFNNAEKRTSYFIRSYYDKFWIDPNGMKYNYDIWEGWIDGPLTDKLVNMFDYLVQIDGSSPATMNDSVIGKWISSGNKHYFWSSQEWGKKLNQGRDTTFTNDDWHNYFMGINTLGPQDVNYVTDGDEKRPYPILPVSEDLIGGELAVFLADSLQLFYYPYYKNGSRNWIDAFIPANDAICCFTDTSHNYVLGVHKEVDGTKTVFLTFDPIGLYTALDGEIPNYPLPGFYWPEYQVTSIVGAALRWFFQSSNIEDKIEIPSEKPFFLFQNYPNPFNSSTSLRFYLEKPSHLTFIIYDMLGQEVCILASDYFSNGIHYIHWNSDDSASGIYFYKIKMGDLESIKKMVLIR
jgi:hypothetical protein